MTSVSIKFVMDKVRDKLEKDKRTRDNDQLLCSLIWWDEGANVMTVKLFLERYAHTNQFSNAESIRRCRQKLQERFIEFRGKYYGKRKVDMQKNIQNELGYG